MFWIDLNLRQYFFVDTHDLQEQNALKWIASDLLKLYNDNQCLYNGIQWKSTFLTVIIRILLILWHNIVKWWQSLHTWPWNLNPYLKNQQWYIMHSLLLLLLVGLIPSIISILS